MGLTSRKSYHRQREELLLQGVRVRFSLQVCSHDTGSKRVGGGGLEGGFHGNTTKSQGEKKMETENENNGAYSEHVHYLVQNRN